MQQLPPPEHEGTDSQVPTQGLGATPQFPTAQSETTKNVGEQRLDFLWRAIGRYDFYFGTTLTRATALTTLNGLVVAGVLARGGDILDALRHRPVLAPVASAGLLLSAAAVFASTWFCFQAAVPYLGRPSTQQPGRSLLFFGHVAARGADDYARALAAAGAEEILDDLAEQAHELARALDAKFVALRWAWLATLYILLPSVFLAIFVWLVGR